jgi:hypothetical protein
MQSVSKEKIISKIKKIENQEILNEVNRLLDIAFDEEIYYTSDEQKEKIKFAQKQIENGETISSIEADKEIDEWLEK